MMAEPSDAYLLDYFEVQLMEQVRLEKPSAR